MKQVFILLSAIFILGTVNTISAQDGSTTTTTAPDTVKYGALQFNEIVHDFGTIAYESDGTFVFTLKNTGENPVILSNVRSSCGCTIPTWPREAILPGQSNSIKVTYDTKRVGSFTKTITVYANTKDSPISLTIKGTVNAKAE